MVAPLIALLLFLGVYPKPLTDIVNPAVEHTMSDVQQKDPQPRPRWRRPSERNSCPQPVDNGGRRRRSTRSRPRHIEYAQLAPALIVVGAAVVGRARRGVRPAQGPLLRAGVPDRRRPGRRLRRGRRPRGRRVRHHQGAHRGDGRHRGRRPGALPAGHHPAGVAGRRLHLRRAPARPGGARQPRRLLRRAGRVRARAATAKRPRSRPGSPPPRSSRWCSSRSPACWSSRPPTIC